MRRTALTALFLATLLAQEPTISVNTHMVEVDVVVKDEKGPVASLTQDDFTILDQGKRQKIAAFAVKRSGDKTPGERPAVPDPPGTVSNRAGGSGATIVLFDLLNTADANLGTAAAPQAFGRLELLKYLRTLEPGNDESFALFSLFKSVRIVHDFTADPKELVAAGEGIKIEHSFDQSAEEQGDQILLEAPRRFMDKATSDMFDNAVKEMQDNARVNRASLTVAALKAIAKHLQAMPGRKKLVWLSAGFPAANFDVRTRNFMPLIETQDFGGPIQQAVRALNNANIAVYPIDPRDVYNSGLAADGIDSMNLLAAGTGGKALYALADVADAIRQAVEDTQVTYTLGFYPSDLKPDGSWHSLSVDVDRRGVDVRARKGYFAPDAKPLTSKEMGKQLKDVVTSPINSTGLSLKARALTPKPGVFDIELTLDPHELHLERENNHWIALLELVAFVPQAHKPNAHQDAIKMTLTDARLREVLMAGRYTLHRSVQFDVKKAADLRVALEDRVTGATGSVLLHVN